MRWVGYQQRYIADQSRWKIVLKSRRIGFSEVMAFVCACRALGIELIPGRAPRMVRPVPQHIISASYAQAKKFLEKVLVHLKAMALAMVSDPVEEGGAVVIKLRNGIVLQAYSTKAATIRGDGGDVTWDECAATPNQEKMWEALKPMANATLGNKSGYRIQIASTPLGDANFFYKLCRGDPDLAAMFSRHEVDWRTASTDGFPFDEAEERKMYPDPDIFAQEFELSFLSASNRYISETEYNAAQYDFEDLPFDLAGPVYGGMDVGRKRDNSAIVTARKTADVLWHLTTEARRAAPWEEQLEWVDSILKPEASRAITRLCVDSTSIGNMFAESLSTKYPGVVEGVEFTPRVKVELATGYKLALVSKRFRPRSDDMDLKRETLSLRRILTSAGNVRYDAPRDKTGHADGAIAAMLAIHAAGGVVKSGRNLPSADSAPDESSRVAPQDPVGTWDGRHQRPSRYNG